MARSGSGRGTATSSVLVGLVALLAGLMFSLSAAGAEESDLRDAPGLRGMVLEQDRTVQDLEARQKE
ncbi:MAG: hypothetical protein LBR19_04205, partial [Bifidobacteriaceae bacterium]|nr:hypothetical protein [Bifidobacteriaceae bacterium]